MRLTYHPEAEAELVEAAEFYQARFLELGERFSHEFDAAVDPARRGAFPHDRLDDSVRDSRLSIVHRPSSIRLR